MKTKSKKRRVYRLKRGERVVIAAGEPITVTATADCDIKVRFEGVAPVIQADRSCNPPQDSQR
jgi:preprotein translocase subunit YajC